MKRIITAVFAAFLMAATSLVFTAPSASAASKGCVTYKEYKSVKRHMSQTRVKQIFGTGGKQIGRYARMEWDLEGYDSEYAIWESNEPQEWMYPSPNDYAPSDDYWYDWTAWYDQAPQVEDFNWWAVDTVRSYKKCRSFDRGRGRVGINFDQYAHPAPGFRVWKKARYSPRSLIPTMGQARMAK